jgi:hypothetical protein
LDKIVAERPRMKDVHQAEIDEIKKRLRSLRGGTISAGTGASAKSKLDTRPPQ